MNRTIKIAQKTLLALAIVSIAVACTREDDINEIFLGHKWKLSFINEGSERRWPTNGTTYEISFAANNFNATTPSGGKITGQWHADGVSRTFRSTNVRVTNVAAKDTLTQRMIDIITNAQEYDGTTTYLKIIKGNDNYIQFK